MKAMQILILGSALVMSSAYANEDSKDHQAVPAKYAALTDHHEKGHAAEHQHVQVAKEKKYNKHDVLRTMFLSKRHYMETKID